MKRNLIMLLSFLLFVLVGCGNESELEGKKIGMTTPDPTSTEEEAENKDIKLTSSMLVFDFDSADEVTLKHNENEYSGSYTLEDTNLSISLDDEDTTLNLDISEFEETPDEYYSYTGKITDIAFEEENGSSQLANISNNLSANETYIFVEE